MSVTFASDAIFPATPAVSCSCAQNMPHLDEVLDVEAAERELPAELVAHVREHAYPGCPRCGGSGLVEGPPPAASYAQCNTAVLAVLGLPEHGACSLPEARRAVIRARNRDLAPFTSPEEVEHGRPRPREDGTVELRPVRFIAFSIDAERLLRMVDRVEALVTRAGSAGASQITWA